METTLQQIGDLAWRAFQSVNTRVPEGRSVEPDWAPGPLPKSHERTRPPLGYPRETDSLCPQCVIETRKKLLNGERQLEDLVDGHIGEIRATFYEKGKELWSPRPAPTTGPSTTSARSTWSSTRSSRAAFPGVTTAPSATRGSTATAPPPFGMVAARS